MDERGSTVGIRTAERDRLGRFSVDDAARIDRLTQVAAQADAEINRVERVRIEGDQSNIARATANLAMATEEAEILEQEREAQRTRLSDIEREIGQVERAIELAHAERDRLLCVSREFEQIQAAVGRFTYERAARVSERHPSDVAATRTVAAGDDLGEDTERDPLADGAQTDTRSELNAIIRRYCGTQDRGR